MPAILAHRGRRALANVGIVQGRLHDALPCLRSGCLKLLLPGLHNAGAREVVLHHPHRQYLPPRVRVVVDALLKHFAAATDLHGSVAEVAEVAGVAEVAATLPLCLATSSSAGAETPAATPKRHRAPARSPRR